MPTLIVLAILMAIFFYAISMYNKLVSKRNMVEEAWSSIDVQLKRRSDLLPNLIQTVKAYMTHEEGLLSKIADLRSKSIAARQVSDQSKVELDMTRTLGQLFAIAENYPDLKANQNFMHMQQQLTELEDHIQMSRRYYNGSVRDFNTRIESFPDLLIASMFNFGKRDFFELENEIDRQVPQVNFGNS
ncbi:MAG: LemA family protein [Cyclobacteriaceae bacterium]|nr:LemA family protein [Cyclobacteriaceae bacterium]